MLVVYFGCVLCPIDSEVIYRRHPYVLFLAKDVKLGFYTIPTANGATGRRMQVHYTTATPRHNDIKFVLCGRNKEVHVTIFLGVYIDYRLDRKKTR